MEKNSDTMLKDVMQSEWMRLSSFANFPLKSPVHTTRLAEAGFYYQNKSDEVTCFSCGGKYSGWKEGDIPKYIHQNIYPHCRFITGSQSGNVSVKHSQNGDSGSTVLASLVSGDINNRPPSCAENAPSDSGACGNSGDLQTSCARTNVGIAGNSSTSDVTSGRSSAGHNNGQQKSKQLYQHPSDAISRDTQNQVQTGHSSNNDTEHMLNTQDTSRRRGSPSQQYETTSHHNDIEPLGISTQRPVYPHYAITIIRLTSFRNWPKNKKQNPQDLAKAGFFHEGSEDRVRCFFCGGGLVNWDPEDDPWIEHARWYPRCVYLRQCKGDNFIVRVQEEVEKGHTDLTHLTDQEDDRRSPTNMMLHPAVVSVLDMGASIDLIQKALLLIPLSSLSAEKLLLKVWELEENITKQDGEKVDVKETPVTDENSQDKNSETNSNVNSVEIPQINEISQVNETSETSRAERIAIMEENRYLKELQLCKICLDEDVSIVFLPCGHMASCASCAPALRKCPICRTFIKGTVKAILS